MSTEINGGGLWVKDPNSKRVVTFTWEDDLDAGVTFAASTFVISGPDEELTQDNDSDTGLTATVRLLGGTPGKKYTLTHRITTDETPPQEDDESITVLIQQK